MNLTFRTPISKVAALLTLVIVLIALIIRSYDNWTAYKLATISVPDGLLKASRIEPGNPDYYFLIGYYYMKYDPRSGGNKIESNYKKAISLLPFNAQYWLSLSQYLHDKGESQKALFALEHSTQLSPGSVSLRWSAGMLANFMNATEQVLSNLNNVIKNDPSRRDKAFSLLWSSVGNGNTISKSIPENALRDYYKYLIKTRRSADAGRVLERLKSTGDDVSDIGYQYVNQLLTEKKFDLAISEWKEIYGQWDGVWNGDFENKIVRRGFDWQIYGTDGVRIRRVKNSKNGKYSLKVEFDGEHNVDFRNLVQFIPVEEGTDYTISSYVMSNNLTTRSGLFWQVICTDSKDLKAKSEMITGTNDWRSLNLDFTTPESCNMIQLILRRHVSDDIGQKISGTLWIDSVAIKKRNQ